jgi:hypothetical protein
MKVKVVKGFNSKEQKIYKLLSDGKPHNFAEMKKLFGRESRKQCSFTYNKGWGDKEVDIQAQSFARNSVRRLIRDGWAEQCARGTYRLTATGKRRVTKGYEITPSAKKGRGRPRKTESEKKAAKKKKQVKRKKNGVKKKIATKMQAAKKRAYRAIVQDKVAKAAARAARAEAD